MSISYPGYPDTVANNKKDKNEQDYLDLIREHFPQNGPGIVLGPGDDCAVVSCPDKICLTTDTLQEDIHFRTAYFPPEAIGHKALAVNISDLAAMGCTPTGFLLSLTLPQDGLKSDFFSRILKGMCDLAAEHDMPLAGGNISRGRDLSLTITAWGTPGPRFLTRKAEAGDILFLIGEIGLARTGLSVLEENREQQTNYPQSIQSLFFPRPWVKEGKKLAELSFVRGLMDISDGPAADLPRLIGPGLGADLDPDFPVHSEVLNFAADSGMDPLEFALIGGEDYALLGAASPGSARELLRLFPHCSFLGRVTENQGLRMDGKPFHGRGFDHFK